MENTTITINKETWRKLNSFRVNPKITFDDVINHLITKQKELNPGQEPGDAFNSIKHITKKEVNVK